jgi:hypothetical protein
MRPPRPRVTRNVIAIAAGGLLVRLGRAKARRGLLVRHDIVSDACSSSPKS